MISHVWEATTAKRMQIDPYCQRQKCSPVNVVSSNIGLADIYSGSGDMGPQTREGGKISYFLALSANISKTVPDNGKSHMGFQLTPRSMTLNCCKVEFSRNFA